METSETDQIYQTKVEIYIQDPTHPENKKESLKSYPWQRVRRLAGRWSTPITGWKAAEEALKILGEKNEKLSERQNNLLKNFQKKNPNHPPLSVGDVVNVDDIDYLCTPTGWEEGFMPPTLEIVPIGGIPLWKSRPGGRIIKVNREHNPSHEKKIKDTFSPPM
jgi:hypothetical protein